MLTAAVARKLLARLFFPHHALVRVVCLVGYPALITTDAFIIARVWEWEAALPITFFVNLSAGSQVWIQMGWTDWPIITLKNVCWNLQAG